MAVNKEIEVEAKKRLTLLLWEDSARCDREGEFVIPTLSSTTSTDAHEVTSPVSTTSSNVTME